LCKRCLHKSPGITMLPFSKSWRHPKIASGMQRQQFSTAGIAMSWYTRLKRGRIHRQGKAVANFDRTLPVPQSDLASGYERSLQLRFSQPGRGRPRTRSRAWLARSPPSVSTGIGRRLRICVDQYRLTVGNEDFFVDLLPTTSSSAPSSSWI